MKTVLLAALFWSFSYEAKATIITLGAQLGYTATDAAGQQVIWARSGNNAIRIVNGQQTVIPRPSGVTGPAIVGFGRPSERGTYLASPDMCGTFQCTVLYAADGTATILSDPAKNVILTQVFEDGTFVGILGDVTSVWVGHISNPGQGTVLGPPAGIGLYGPDAFQATRVNGAMLAAGAQYGTDGFTSYAVVQTATETIQLDALTQGSVAFGISGSAAFAAGGDGGKAVVWDFATRRQIQASTTSDGLYFSVLNSSAAAGEDSQGRGIVYSPYFGTVMNTCSFIEATGGVLPAGYRNAQGECTIGRTHLSEFLDPVTNRLTVNIAGSGSVIDFSPPNAIYFNAPGWEQASVPEPQTATIVAFGLASSILVSWRKRHWRRQSCPEKN